jgi:hypothetical protein
VLQSVTATDSGNYYVVVSNPSGSISSQIPTIAVDSPGTPPVIIGQPISATTTVGGFVGFGVDVAGTTPWTFQWQKNGIDIPGATAPFYIISPVTLADAGLYDVVVSNINGSVTSNPAQLTVTKAQVNSISLGNLDQAYDGAPKPVTVTTDPTGLAVSVTYNGSPTAPIAVGSYAVVATVIDPAYQGNVTGTLVIRDETAPVISSVRATPGVLAKPNHKMVPVTITVNATDDVDPHPTATIVAVWANEPINGKGDGNTNYDWEITGDLTLNLRDERSGNNSGRVYTMLIMCRDSSWNLSFATVTVTVPKG